MNILTINLLSLWPVVIFFLNSTVSYLARGEFVGMAMMMLMAMMMMNTRMMMTTMTVMVW